MSRALRTRRPLQEHDALPPEIYLPLVASLYKDGGTLLVGTILVTGSILVTYWKTSDILLFYCALAFVLVACARGLLIRTYARLRTTITSNEIARRWEHRYVAGASASVALLGILVLSRILAELRFICPSRQLFNDDCLCGGHLRTKLWKHTFCHRPSFMRVGANDSGALALWKSV